MACSPVSHTGKLSHRARWLKSTICSVWFQSQGPGPSCTAPGWGLDLTGGCSGPRGSPPWFTALTPRAHAPGSPSPGWVPVATGLCPLQPVSPTSAPCWQAGSGHRWGRKDACGRGSPATVAAASGPWCPLTPPLPYKLQAHQEPQRERKPQPPEPPDYLPLLQRARTRDVGWHLGPAGSPPSPLHTAACPPSLSPLTSLSLSLLQPTAPCSEVAVVSRPFLRAEVQGWVGGGPPRSSWPPCPPSEPSWLLCLPKAAPSSPPGTPPISPLRPSLLPPTPSALPGLPYL